MNEQLVNQSHPGSIPGWRLKGFEGVHHHLGGRTVTFGSLFTGIGGLDLGFERAGLSCAWQCEIDDYCRRVLSKHWPDIPKHDNVMTFTGEGFERPDIICGGFPCQDVSLAGERAGLAGKRSGLWSEFARLIRFFRPRYVFVENVPGLLSPVDDGSVAPIADVLGDMAACGYDAEWQSIPAYVFGSTQERFRVCIVAYAAGLGSGQRGIPVFPQRWEGPCDSQGAGESDRRASGLGANRECDSHALRAGREELHISAVAVEPGFDHRIPDADAHADGFGIGRADDQRRNSPFVGSGWWGVEPPLVRMVHGLPRRMVRDAIRGLGNCVIPQLAEWVGRRIVEHAKVVAS